MIFQRKFILVILLLATNCFADSSGIQYFDEEESLSRSAAWEFISEICSVGLGQYGAVEELKCGENGCKGEVTYSESSYAEEIILDSDFNLLFSKKHRFDNEVKEEKSVKNEDGNLNLTLVVEKSGLNSENVKSLIDCVKKMGEMLAEETVGSEKKALLSEEYDYSELNSDFKTKSFVLKGLDYSKVSVHYPSSITAGEIVPIQIVVIPSLRFTLNLDRKAPDIDVSEEAARKALEKVEYPKNSLLNKLGISLSGEYQKSSFQSGELKLRNNDFSVLSISIKGKGSSFEKVTPTKLPLTGLVPSRWLWEMETKDSGDQKLYIEFKSENQDNGKKFYLLKPTTIEVEFSLLQSILAFITKHWQWILGTILIPLVVYAWNRKSKNE